MEGDLQRVLGLNLRAHRERLGISQETLAHRIGCHRTYIGAIERGERNLALRTVERFGDLLGIPAIDLLWDRQRIVVEVDDDGEAHLTEQPVTEQPVARAAADDADAGPDADDAPAPPARRRRRPAPPSD